MTDDFKTAAAAETAFYQAFRDLDGDRMGEVWADSEEIFCVHPGGPLLRGRAAVLGSWLEIFAGADPPQLDYRLLHREQHAEIAVHLVEEYIRPNGSRAEGAAVVLATNVYLLTDGGWRIFNHHASTPLVRQQSSRPTRQMH